jgi:hypothetical protein
MEVEMLYNEAEADRKLMRSITFIFNAAIAAAFGAGMFLALSIAGVFVN